MAGLAVPEPPLFKQILDMSDQELQWYRFCLVSLLGVKGDFSLVPRLG